MGLDPWGLSGEQGHNHPGLPASRFHLHEKDKDFTLFRPLLIWLSNPNSNEFTACLWNWYILLFWGLPCIISSSEWFYGHSVKSLRQVRFHFFTSAFFEILRKNLPEFRRNEGWNTCLDLNSRFLFNSKELQLIGLLVMSFYSAFLVLWHLRALLTLERLPFLGPVNAQWEQTPPLWACLSYADQPVQNPHPQPLPLVGSYSLSRHSSDLITPDPDTYRQPLTLETPEIIQTCQY